MNFMFVSFGIFLISIILATVSNTFFDVSLPKELTMVNFITESSLIVWVIPMFLLIVILTTAFVLKKLTAPESIATIKKMTDFSALVLLLLQVFIISNNSNINYDMNMVIGVFVGIVMIVLANFMQKTKANLAYGLRLPWTLKDEKVWRKSNRFAAKLLMLAGLLILSLAFIMPNELEVIVLTVLAVTVVLSIIFSYMVSKQQTA